MMDGGWTSDGKRDDRGSLRALVPKSVSCTSGATEDL